MTMNPVGVSPILEMLARWAPISGRIRVHWDTIPRPQRWEFDGVPAVLDAVTRRAGSLAAGEALLVVEDRRGQDVLVIGSERDRPVDEDATRMLESSHGLAVWLVKQPATV